MGVPGRGFRGQEEDTRMKKTLVLAGCGVLAAALAGAAEIHGSVTDGGKPVAAGVAVRLDCGGTTAAAKTDSFGSYSVKAASGARVIREFGEAGQDGKTGAGPTAPVR